MARRWKILICIGLFVAVTDQLTKFLAVRNLTPGIARAHATATNPTLLAASTEEQAKAAQGLGFFEELGYFYSGVKSPCGERLIRSTCPAVQVVPDFWSWSYQENKGAAWGLFASSGDTFRVPFFLLISVGAIVFIISFFRKLPDSQLLLVISLSLVFGGAVGNFIDRLHLSYVIDFIDWYVGASHWPTFNFADAAITTGVALLIVQWIRDGLAARRSAANETAKSSAA